MMVDLDDDPEWSVQDEIEDEDEERFVQISSFIRFKIKQFNFKSSLYLFIVIQLPVKVLWTDYL